MPVYSNRTVPTIVEHLRQHEYLAIRRRRCYYYYCRRQKSGCDLLQGEGGLYEPAGRPARARQRSGMVSHVKLA